MGSLDTHPLRHLYSIDRDRSRRVSSWDRTGGNSDWLRVEGGETAVLADITGPGLITHIYCALAHADPFDLRDAVLRAYWDDEIDPSVEVPLGDFFGVPHCRMRDFTSQLLTISPGKAGSHGMSAYFPMPFGSRALITLEHQGDSALGGALGALWYHIDYEELATVPADNVGRFHASWRRENITKSADLKYANRQLWPGSNLAGDENFIMLEAEGNGQVTGIHLQVDNIAGGWWGEGDDMWFIDGEQWPPAIHGTGTEEIFSGGACPEDEYARPFTGFHLIENLNGEMWSGKSAMYRWFVVDPVRFKSSVRATIEHGHANNFENDYVCVGYWYQGEPHRTFEPLASRDARRPRLPASFESLRLQALGLTSAAIGAYRFGTAEFEKAMIAIGEVFEAMYQGDFDTASDLAARAIPDST